MMMTHQEVRTILPHRYPIVMVDRIVACQTGHSIHAIKNVSRDEPCFGIVPVRPVAGDASKDSNLYYPRTLVLESFLQAGGVLCYQAWSQSRDLSTSAILFGGLIDFRWFSDVPVGSTLHHYAFIETMFESAAVYRGEIKVDDRLIATIGQVTIAVRSVNELTNPRGGNDDCSAFAGDRIQCAVSARPRCPTLLGDVDEIRCDLSDRAQYPRV